MFTAYYYKLTHLNFKALCPQLVTAKILSIEDSHIVQHTVEPSKAASHVLEKIHATLQGGTEATFDDFLSILKNHHDSFCTSLVKEMRIDLLKSTTGTVCIIILYSSIVLFLYKYVATTLTPVEQPNYRAVENPQEESTGQQTLAV